MSFFGKGLHESVCNNMNVYLWQHLCALLTALPLYADTSIKIADRSVRASKSLKDWPSRLAVELNKLYAHAVMLRDDDGQKKCKKFRPGHGTVAMTTSTNGAHFYREKTSKTSVYARRRQNLFHSVFMYRDCQIYCRKGKIVLEDSTNLSFLFSCSLVEIKKCLKKKWWGETWF